MPVFDRLAYLRVILVYGYCRLCGSEYFSCLCQLVRLRLQDTTARKDNGKWSRPFIILFRLAVLDYLSYCIVFDRDAERNISAISGTKFYCCHPHGVQSAATNMGLFVDRRIAGRLITFAILKSVKKLIYCRNKPYIGLC